MTAAETFRVALLDVTARGQRAPCEGPDRYQWTSEDPRERAQAARTCRDACPLLDLCAAAAREVGERHGVWGGKDRTRTPKERTAS
jgi:hypothetical protein